MYKVKDTTLNKTYEFTTLDKAVEFVEQEVRENAFNAYDSEQIDKYALEDILFDNYNHIKKQMGFEYDDLPNVCFKIENLK